MSGPSAGIPVPALERLERRVGWGLRNLQATRVSGVVTEVAMSHYRVAGLSRFLKLGECVSVDVGDRCRSARSSRSTTSRRR
jgi:flagellum-specific ATP synthase